MKRILIIEDDTSILELQKDYLTMSGYEVVCAFDGVEGTKYVNEGGFDLVILDLMLPGRDGFELLKEITALEIPVLIVSAKTDETHKIRGLNMGADDYITKPFGMGELVARVNSHIKKYHKFRKSGGRNISAGVLTIDREDRRVYAEENEVLLTQKEFDLLLFLADHPNRVFGKEELFEKVWGYDALSDTTTVTVHIARIREKIEKASDKFHSLETVWGAGYRFKV
jgi:two-component system OmpR family response regulator